MPKHKGHPGGKMPMKPRHTEMPPQDMPKPEHKGPMKRGKKK